MRKMNKYEFSSWKRIREIGRNKFILTRGVIPGSIIYLLLMVITVVRKGAIKDFKDIILSFIAILSICLLATIIKWYREERRYLETKNN